MLEDVVSSPLRTALSSIVAKTYTEEEMDDIINSPDCTPMDLSKVTIMSPISPSISVKQEPDDLSPCILLEDIPLKNDTFTPQYNEAISIDTYTYNHFHDEETAKSITEEGKKRMQECLKDLNL